MVKKDGAAASIEENAEVQAPAEEQSNVQSSTAESVETQAPNEEDAEMQALFEGLDGNEPEQSGAEETAPKGKPTRADVLREARRRRAERSESVRAYQEFLIGLSSLTVAAKNHSIVNGLVSHIEQRNDVDSEVPCVMIIALVEGRYKVSIPFDEFYQKNPIDMATVNTLGLPDNTTQVEISASATKVRTVEHPAWEEKEFWQNLVAEHIMGVDLVDAVRNGEVDGLKIEPSEDEAGYVKMMMRRRLKDNEQWDSETVEDDPYELSSAILSSLTIRNCQQLLKPYLE